MRFFQHCGLREGGCKFVIMGCRPFLQPYFVNGPLNHDGSAWAPISEGEDGYAEAFYIWVEEITYYTRILL